MAKKVESSCRDGLVCGFIATMTEADFGVFYESALNCKLVKPEHVVLSDIPSSVMKEVDINFSSEGKKKVFAVALIAGSIKTWKYDFKDKTPPMK